MSEFTEKYNIHTHSFFCGHGDGTIAEYAGEAEAKGLLVLGFSEHCPLPDGRLRGSRMTLSDMPLYEKAVAEEREKRPFSVLTGYECDHFPEYAAWHRGLKESGRASYLISGTHYIFRPDGKRVSPFYDRLTADDLSRYRDLVVAAIQSGIYDFLAHPDLYMAGWAEWDEKASAIARDIITEAVKADLPLEINGNGLHKPMVNGRLPYPHAGFWDLASDLGARCVLSTDAHKVELLTASKPWLEEYARSRAVTITGPVPGKDHLEWRL